ncbi:hypothetical protein KAU19_02360 [Candidatus Parcubacteria bacterium]|nr:hypothetical protein [Candidatus Parcubacteria bacterium]
MSLKIRRLLYITFILIFLIIAPMMIFYAAGYKFSLSGIKFQRTGTFIFDTKPKGAKIFINGQPQQTFFKKYYSQEKSFIKTPAKIKNLLPGEYNIKFELDSYWPWQKKLTIYPGTSTYAEDIYLFKKNLPILLLPDKINNSQLSPDKNKLTILINKQITILNLTNEEQTKLPFINRLSTTTYSWSPSSKKILLNKSIINIKNGKESRTLGIDLTDYVKNEINNLKWDFYSDDKLYYNDKNNIYSFSLSTKSKKIILQYPPTNNYLIKDNNIYLIEQLGNTNNLNIFNLDSGELVRKINLPGSDNYYFINPTHSLLNLYDQDHKILYLINPLSLFYSPVQETINNIQYTYWVNNNKLLYANDFEVWLFDLEHNQKTLLTRISQGITGIIWHPSNNYIIYSTDITINTIELDEREKHNITEIIKLDKIAFPVLNQKGDTLYFYAKIGNQEGLYKLAIH